MLKKLICKECGNEASSLCGGRCRICRSRPELVAYFEAKESVRKKLDRRKNGAGVRLNAIEADIVDRLFPGAADCAAEVKAAKEMKR